MAKVKHSVRVIKPMGVHKLGEKTRNITAIGFQMVDGKPTHEKPRFIIQKQVEKDGKFTTIKSAGMDLGDLVRDIKTVGGIKTLRTLVKNS